MGHQEKHWSCVDRDLGQDRGRLLTLAVTLGDLTGMVANRSRDRLQMSFWGLQEGAVG
jgi:hypothetical protein